MRAGITQQEGSILTWDWNKGSVLSELFRIKIGKNAEFHASRFKSNFTSIILTMSLDLSSMPAKIQLMYETLKQQNLHGTDQDTIPEGFGEFGLEITNPVPTDTIIGSAIYLAGLRTSEGMKVDSERMGSNEAANVENPIDLYRIRENGKVIAIIYISAYHKKNSGRAPEGFKII